MTTLTLTIISNKHIELALAYENERFMSSTRKNSTYEVHMLVGKLKNNKKIKK